MFGCCVLTTHEDVERHRRNEASTVRAAGGAQDIHAGESMS